MIQVHQLLYKKVVLYKVKGKHYGKKNITANTTNSGTSSTGRFFAHC